MPFLWLQVLHRCQDESYLSGGRLSQRTAVGNAEGSLPSCARQPVRGAGNAISYSTLHQLFLLRAGKQVCCSSQGGFKNKGKEKCTRLPSGLIITCILYYSLPQLFPIPIYTWPLGLPKLTVYTLCKGMGIFISCSHIIFIFILKRWTFAKANIANTHAPASQSEQILTFCHIYYTSLLLKK